MNKFKYTALTGLAALALTLSACGNTASSNNEAQTETAPVTQAVAAAELAAGTFSGRSDHITTGTASLVKTDAGYQLVLSADFELDGAPDPIVAFGNNETYDAANKLGALKNRTGAQRYDLPANFTPANFSQVYVWCEKFNVPLGVATLTKANGEYGS